MGTGEDSCPRCGEPGPQALMAGRCTYCVGRELEYAGARGAFRHQGVARSLVAEFKFGGQPVLGRLMAELARPTFDGFVDSLGSRGRLLVTWVPCHRSSERERGYNQAEVLARQLASGPQPLMRAGLVRKTKATKHQKSLGRAGRQENLRGVFSLDETAPLHVLSDTDRVVLVDDVFTTGATAREVSSVLRKGIGLPVHVFTFSRALAGTPERHD
jgi:ComF family protein